MNCKKIGELFISYLDGELTEKERKIVELHLSACPHCRDELKSLSATQDRLRRDFEMAANGTVPLRVWGELQQRLATEEQSRVTVFSRAKSRLKRGTYTTKAGLCSQQPVWKSSLAGALAMAFIVILALVIPPFLGQPQEVLAAEIAQNDPQVQSLLSERTIVKVARIERTRQDGIFHVLFQVTGESIWGGGDKEEVVMINALVNIQERKVIELKAVRTEEIPIALLSLAEKEKAIRIARADSRVQEILDRGLTVRDVIPLPFFRLPDSLLNTKVVGVVLLAPSSDSQVIKWIAAVDLDEGKVAQIVKRTPQVNSNNYASPENARSSSDSPITKSLDSSNLNSAGESPGKRSTSADTPEKTAPATPTTKKGE